MGFEVKGTGKAGIRENRGGSGQVNLGLEETFSPRRRMRGKSRESQPHFPHGRIGQQGVAITPENLRIADNATLILPLHRELDHFRETSNAVLKIGTTKRGIGPTYGDKAARVGLRVIDLIHPERFEEKLRFRIQENNQVLKALGAKPLKAEKSTNFSLGAVIYTLLAGFGWTWTGEVWSCLEADTELDAALRPVLARAVAPHPSDRHPSMAAFRDALARYLDDAWFKSW